MLVMQEGYRSHNQCEVPKDEDVPLPSPGKEENSDSTSNQPREKKRKRMRRNQDGEFVCEVCGAHYTKLSSLKVRAN